LHKSVSEIRNLDKEEILQWEAFDEYIEPIGGRRIDVAAASIIRTLHLVNTTDKNFQERYKSLDFVEGHVDYKGLGIIIADKKPKNPVTSLLTSNNKSNRKNKSVLQDTLGGIGRATNTKCREYSKKELDVVNENIKNLLNESILRFDKEAEEDSKEEQE